MNHCGPDTASADVRMHHQLRHGGRILLPWRKVQVTDDSFAAGWIATDGQQVLGALICQLPQNLLADGCHLIELPCHADEFTYLLLFFCGQHHPPPE